MEISNLSLAENSTRNSTVYLYTGTSCMNSGTKEAKAAVCICTNENENDTMIELLNQELCTNQKADLHAIYRALSMIRDEENIVIISRSEYAVKCITEWSTKWKESNWKKVPKSSIENITLIEEVLDLLHELLSADKSIQIWHSGQVPNKRGNQIAQKFAREGLVKHN